MKKFKFKIPLYDWDITFIEVTSKKDAKKIGKIYKKFKADKESREDIVHAIKKGRVNGGRFTYDTLYCEAIILIFKTTSKKERRKVIRHESRHCEDRVLQHAHVYDIEASAYLAGFLASKIY